MQLHQILPLKFKKGTSAIGLSTSRSDSCTSSKVSFDQVSSAVGTIFGVGTPMLYFSSSTKIYNLEILIQKL
jgi:hypothetical protein